MKKIIHRRLRSAILAALAAGGLAATTQAAEVIAYWDFEKIEADGIHIKAAQGPYEGEILGDATLTDDGRAGGGKAFSVGLDTPGKLFLEATGDDNPMNKAAADDQVTVVFWQKNNSNLSASSFWFESESSNNGNRGFQAHVPWGTGDVYFDTQGCCTAPTQRINISANSVFPDHDFLVWHHYAFVKNGGAKTVYIDGEVLMNQDEGADPLSLDYYRINIGGAQGAGGIPDSIMDDFAIFKGALSQDEIKAIVGGAPIGVPPLDTDKDGMPDNWETQYGFNPNDPSDAALDFDGDGVTNLDEFKAGTNPVDVTKPVVNSAASTSTFDTVVVTFSENVDPTSATALANYSITPSVAVTGATVKKNVVTLTTAAQTPGATKYTLTVSGVLDGSKNAVAANSTAVFYSYIQIREGVLKASIFTGIPGNAVQGLFDDPRWPDSPDRVGAVFSANSRDILPTDSLEAYAGVMEGYFTPTESGDYNFFWRSDDGGQFYISPDETPAGLALVAEETGCCAAFLEPDEFPTQTTQVPITLVANKKYYIRGIWKEGGGGDYGQVAFRKIGDLTPAASLLPIPSKYLSSAVDLPAAPEGAFVTQSPAPNAKNVSPAATLTIAHRDGKTPWTEANVSLKFDGSPVTPVFTKDGGVLTLTYTPPALFESLSVHTITLDYLDAGGNAATTSWSFTATKYNGTTADKVGGYAALLLQNGVISADALGHTGKAGDSALDTTTKGGPAVTYDKTFLTAVNAATAQDELTVSFWQKKHDTADSSAFQVNSPTAGNNRTFHAHVPWSNQNIYFDTTGCCDATTQRIFADVADFPGYTLNDPRDNLWWTTEWHHFVFTKKGSAKNIYIDGQPFLSGDSTGMLQSDANAWVMGAGANGSVEQNHALMDDFAVFGKELTVADALALKNGTLPTALPANKGLIGYWDFNTAPVTLPNVSINGSTITFTGILQSSTTLNGTFAPVAGATSPYTVPAATTGAVFYRSAQ